MPERIRRVGRLGCEALSLTGLGGGSILPETIRELTQDRGADAVIDAVGMEAHGSPLAESAHHAMTLLPEGLQESLLTKAGVDRLEAVYQAIDCVRRGGTGTVSVVGRYGGAADPLPLLQLFDKQIQLRMRQANVRRWTADLLQVLDQDDDVLGVECFATRRLPLEEAAQAYAAFQNKSEGMVKTVFLASPSCSKWLTL